MTLGAMIDLIPNHILDQSQIYRVKDSEPDRMNELFQLVYVQKRYVAIMPYGKTPLCTCFKQIHHGIPCRHYFAVMFRRQNVPFSIGYFNRHWIQPEFWTTYKWDASIYLPSAGEQTMEQNGSQLTMTKPQNGEIQRTIFTENPQHLTPS